MAIRRRRKRTRKQAPLAKTVLPRARGKVGGAIRAARRAVGLTQDQLGARIGRRGRALYRWERDEVAPTKTNQRLLIKAVRELNPAAASALAVALGLEAAPPPKATSEEVLISATVGLKHAIYRAADELDVTPRQLRGPMLRMFRSLSIMGLTVERVQKMIEEWREEGGEVAR